MYATTAEWDYDEQHPPTGHPLDLAVCGDDVRFKPTPAARWSPWGVIVHGPDRVVSGGRVVAFDLTATRIGHRVLPFAAPVEVRPWLPEAVRDV